MKSKKQTKEKEEKIRKKKNQNMRNKHIQRNLKISSWYSQRRDMETTLITENSDQNRIERNKREKKKNQSERRK